MTRPVFSTRGLSSTTTVAAASLDVSTSSFVMTFGTSSSTDYEMVPMWIAI